MVVVVDRRGVDEDLVSRPVGARGVGDERSGEAVERGDERLV